MGKIGQRETSRLKCNGNANSKEGRKRDTCSSTCWTVPNPASRRRDDVATL